MRGMGVRKGGYDRGVAGRTVSGYASSSSADCLRYSCEVAKYGMVMVAVVVMVGRWNCMCVVD